MRYVSRVGGGWRAALALLVLVSALHHDVLFLGRSLAPTNQMNPLDYRPLPQNYGPGMVPPQAWTSRNLWPYANVRDPGGSWWLWEPSLVFLRRAMERREWPFWDPYAGGGAPAMADLTSAFFFPPSLAVVALGASAWLKSLYFLSLLWVASFFSFLFLRQHGLAFSSSLFGAVAVLMGGALNQHLGTLMGQTGAWLPCVLYATRAFLDAPTARRVAGLALTYAAVSLASFPPVLLGVFGLATAYVLVAVWLDADLRPRARVATRWLYAVALSLGLVAAYYLPALALWRANPPHVQAVYAGAGLESILLRNVYQLLSPTLMGGVQVYQSFVLSVIGLPHFPYVGVVALLAAALALRAEGRRRLLFAFSAIATAVIFLKLLGVPPVQWVGRLPVLDHVHFAHYFGIPLGIGLTFLSALGMDSLLRGGLSIVRAALVSALALLAVGSLWAGAARYGLLARPSAEFWLRDWMVLAGLTVVTAAALLVAASLRHRPAVAPAVAGALLLLVCVEGAFNNTYPRPQAWDIFAEPVSYVRFLKDNGGLQRVMPFGAPNANLNSAFDIFSMDSLMSFNPPRAFQLYHRYAGAPPWLFMREATQIPPERVLDRAGVDLVATRDVFTRVLEAARARGYAQVFADGYVTVFKRPTEPRFFFSSEYRVVSTAEALELVAHAPAREVVLEEPPGVPRAANRPDDPPVRVASYRRNSFVLDVEAPRPGLVYASENFFDGWSAFVDGTRVPILPANYAYRAIAVPAGRARVEFRYWPPGLTPGLIVSALSVGVLLLLLVPRGAWRARTPQAF